MNKMSNAPQLVLAGGRGWLCDDIYETAKALDLGDDILLPDMWKREKRLSS